jgi:hypothetical protein
MEIENLNPNRYRFTGRAGALLRDGAIASLIRELGDNYAAYHEQLASEFARWGGPPDPSAYAGDFERYSQDCSIYADLIRSESLLRRARLFRMTGRGLAQLEPAGEAPWVADGRLVDVRDPSG